MATVQSAVRVPTPQPGDPEPATDARPEVASRKRSPTSRSPSPRREAPKLRRRSPSPRRNGPLPRDVDRSRAVERARQFEMRQREQEPQRELTAEEKQEAAKAELAKLQTSRAGGTYIPPAKLRALQAQITDKTSAEYQRMTWDALKKSLNGLINKVNVANIKHIVPELFNENLIRGRGLFCKSIMRAQSASLSYTATYAAMAAVVNTKLPAVIELLVHRLILQFRKSMKRHDKKVCVSSTTFIAHLVNQQVVHEMLAAQILLILLNNATDDSVEIAVALTKEVGAHLEEMNAQIAHAVFEQFRNILNNADITKRSQYMIEVLFQIRKDKYQNHQGVKDELDLVEEEDQITHNPNLEDSMDAETRLDVFKFDPEYESSEAKYTKIKAEILGEDSGSEAGSDEDEEESSDDDEEAAEEKAMEIKDQTSTDLVNLRRTIYLKIMSSGTFEECVHKLMYMNLPTGNESELPNMIIECASQERTYNKFYGNTGARLCQLRRNWMELFEEQFGIYYETIHRFETNRLRIIAHFMAHLLASDAISWNVLHHIKINEDDTTSSSRIFIKILLEEMSMAMGMKKLVARLKSPELQPALAGFFPIGDAKKARFSINYFTSINMGVLTEDMREWLNNIPPPAPVVPAARSPSRSESVSSYSSYSSRSDSRSPPPKTRNGRGRSYSRSPTPQRRGRDRSDSYSRSPYRNGKRRAASYSRSRSPPRRRARSASYDSRSPPPKRAARRYSTSPSRSPAPRRGGGRRDSYSDDSRSPPPRKRGYSSSRSRSPPRRNGANRSRRSPSPRSKRGGRARSYTSSDASRSPSRSRPPPRRARPAQPAAERRRRNTSSPESSRSRSRSPPRRTGGASKAERGGEASISKPVPAAAKKDEAEDLSGIHPSRRGLMGNGKPKASDFM